MNALTLLKQDHGNVEELRTRHLEIIQEKNRAQGKTAAVRADLRFDANAAGQIFLLNKADGTLRVIER